MYVYIYIIYVYIIYHFYILYIIIIDIKTSWLPMARRTGPYRPVPARTAPCKVCANIST